VKATYKQRSDSEEPEFNLDAYHLRPKDMLIINAVDHGNISTFIEPRSNANLVPVSVSCGRSLNNHRIAFFAARDIYPNEEVNYHPNLGFNWDKYLMNRRGSGDGSSGSGF
jgi:SET domain-containing protein